MDNKYQAAGTWVSPGVQRDGGGLMIVNGHIVVVGPWNPLNEAKSEFEEIYSAVAVMQIASKITDTEVRSVIQKSAADVVTKHINQLVK